MIQRLISAIVMLAIIIPAFILGGTIFNILILVLSVLGLREFLNIKQTKKDVPFFIQFISYVMLTLFICTNVSNKDIIYSVDYRLITGLFLVFSVPAVLYHDRSLYSIVDSFYFIGAIFFLGISFSLMILYRNMNVELLIYLVLITAFTDTFAYIIGMLIGKHKLIEEVSPKKTWEGTIAGSIFGTFIATCFYITIIDSCIELYIVVFMTLFLSVLGQFGDLFFSSIKRYYSKKDFSNLIPGHGGILDRLDSIIFVILGFTFFITII